MKRILVTGATGFIGNYVVKELLKNNCEVIASARSMDKAYQFDWFSQVQFIAFDFKGFDNNIHYYDYFNRPDALVHLAWEGLPNYTKPFHLDENLPVHIAFLKNLVLGGLKDVTVTGTCFEYGMKDGCLSEDTATDPANAYAMAKDRLHVFLQELQEEQSFDLKWVRLFYMYGKGQNPNSLLSQLDNAVARGEKMFNMSGGEQVRDYMAVEEVAYSLVKIALQNEVTGTINCCSGCPVTVKQLVEAYIKKNNLDIQLNLGYYPYASYEPMAFWGDNTKLKMIK
jgi:dTDP-6-deoxy-L-talose 4-dehydrogenase (NAD+)